MRIITKITTYFVCILQLLGDGENNGTGLPPIEKLSEFKNRVGDFGTLVYTSVPSFNEDIYKNSLKLFANEVIFKKS